MAYLQGLVLSTDCLQQQSSGMATFDHMIMLARLASVVYIPLKQKRKLVPSQYPNKFVLQVPLLQKEYIPVNFEHMYESFH